MTELRSGILPYSGPSRWNIDQIVAELYTVRARWRSRQQRNQEETNREFPSREVLRRLVQQLTGALFPMRLGPADLKQTRENYYIGHTLGTVLDELLAQVKLELRYAARHTDPTPEEEQRAVDIVADFAAQLPDLRALLDTDVQAAFDNDPAARSVDEVLLCYPGITAIIHHRLAHALYRLGAPLVARIVAEIAHGDTGIDIHPGAAIGGSFFIDHGTGVVIGETTVIGERVRLYQAVTLGARRFPTDQNGVLQKGVPRHPVIEDDVVIYAGATLLGRITVGSRSVIGGNVWLTHSVDADTHITQNSLLNTPAAEILAEPAG
ncbi:serine O-acetyltransferase EpsC [Corticimicrobacter populi]|uniref:serine O-acetyltransferase n=1 Tax=Corticimicrobacter populi TaxID=2175229 RepID=A0A2V1K159_9BURK|nr:serine O-acetyltransferase EpsC [Corticimicrobacter populi]PWF24178.1 serine acetyltransferase [Corticimicrobacter populi]QDQ87970.1 serine acetyltransferase [Alcaligenaceae bacterium SJ-26]